MATPVAILVGLLLGVIGLFPGLHFSMVLLFAGPWLMQVFDPGNALIAMASAVVSAKCMHTLAVVYHPVSGDNLASADPAQRLAARGQGKLATSILAESLWISTRMVAFGLGILLFAGFLLKENLIKMLMQGLSFVSLPAIVLWFWFTVYTSKNKIGTLLVMLSSGALGVIALNSPSIRGAQHAMTPLLTGLFALPVLLLTLLEKKPKHKRVQILKAQSDEVPEELKWTGMLVGLTSVVLPGLGTSSLTSIGQDMADTDAKYLTMAGFAESTGELLALALGILGLASRSSDAAMVQKILQAGSEGISFSPFFGFILIGTLMVSCWMGLHLMNKLSFPYRFLVNLIPNKMQALLVGLSMVWVVWTHTYTWGLGILLAGILIHLGARQLKTSNQAFFACMILPMMLSMLQIRLF